jgi:GDP-4-dehydro-6-deoxy-D-mannose reductase
VRVLVTGGTGFVGSHLVGLLKSRASKITVMSMEDPPRRDVEVEYFQADIRDEQRIRSILLQIRPDQVYHLAAISSADLAWRNPRLTYEVNVLGTYNLCQAAMGMDAPPVLLNVSTSQVYAPGSDALSEGCALGPDNPYAISKAMAELLVYQYRGSSGGIITARAFNHSGEGQPPSFVLPSIARQFAEVELGRRPPKLRLGNLAVARDFTDVRDVVRAYATLVERGRKNDVYNVCSGTAVRLTEIIEMFQSASGIRVTVEVDADKVRSNEPARICGDARKIRSDTGWMPEIPLEKTVRDLFDYWLSECRIRDRAALNC